MTVTELPVYGLNGKEVRRLKVDEPLSDAKLNRPLLSQAILMMQANQRQGTHATKTRGEVSGGGKKPWRQKGTGRARAGSIRSPLWRHGGTTFGPMPREYRKVIPKQMRVRALQMSLQAKLQDHELLLVEPLFFDKPKTKGLASFLKTLPLKGKTLVVVGKMTLPLQRSARNIPRLLLKAGKDINAYDLLKARSVVIEEAAFEALLKEKKA